MFDLTRRGFATLLGGAAAAWPLPARAQQSARPVVGFLSSLSYEGSLHFVAAFQRGLSDLGFVDGENVTIEYRWARGQYDRLPAMAAELVSRPVAILVTTGGEPAALAAKAATSTIPIVFNVGGDPVKLGLVASYNRPSGNATGINMLTETMEPKRLGILRELLPQTPTIAVLVNPRFPPAEMQLKEIEAAARTVGMKTQPFHASIDTGIEPAFQSMVQQQIRALIVATDPFFVTRRDDLIDLAARYKLPTIYGFRDIAVAGGLMSYGIDLVAVYRQQAFYVNRILRGEKVADLPVMQPTKFDLVINLKTAKALGLTFPPSLLAVADEVIE
jgi:putative ABC transport system substrate-binding protein